MVSLYALEVSSWTRTMASAGGRGRCVGAVVEHRWPAQEGGKVCWCGCCACGGWRQPPALLDQRRPGTQLPRTCGPPKKEAVPCTQGDRGAALAAGRASDAANSSSRAARQQRMVDRARSWGSCVCGGGWRGRLARGGAASFHAGATAVRAGHTVDVMLRAAATATTTCSRCHQEGCIKADEAQTAASGLRGVCRMLSGPKSGQHARRHLC
jgi:hypothetical protein